ncbi:hypothetical protein NN561_018113 [Cricetulus griseus]
MVRPKAQRVGRQPRAAAGVQGAGRHAPGPAARQAYPGHLRPGIRDLKARRSGARFQSPSCSHTPTRWFLPTWIPLPYLVSKPCAPYSRSFAPCLWRLQNPAPGALQQVGTRQRPRDVPIVSLSSYQSTPAWAGGTAVQQTYLRGQGAGTEL